VVPDEARSNGNKMPHPASSPARLLGLRENIERIVITRSHRRSELTRPLVDNEALNWFASKAELGIYNPAVGSVLDSDKSTAADVLREVALGYLKRESKATVATRRNLINLHKMNVDLRFI
jgi:hypothetical protein